MTTITADLAGLAGGTVTLSFADLDGLSARAEGPLLREGDDHCDDAVVVWNGMVTRCPADTGLRGMREPTCMVAKPFSDVCCPFAASAGPPKVLRCPRCCCGHGDEPRTVDTVIALG